MYQKRIKKYINVMCDESIELRISVKKKWYLISVKYKRWNRTKSKLSQKKVKKSKLVKISEVIVQYIHIFFAENIPAYIRAIQSQIKYYPICIGIIFHYRIVILCFSLRFFFRLNQRKFDLRQPVTDKQKEKFRETLRCSNICSAGIGWL